MMKENQFASKTTRSLRDCNAWVLSIVGNRMQMAGWPDIYCAHRRWQGFIEFKGKETKLREDQRFIIRKLKERDVNVFIVRYPNWIEDEWGNLLAKYEQFSGKSLLAYLEELSCPTT